MPETSRRACRPPRLDFCPLSVMSFPTFHFSSRASISGNEASPKTGAHRKKSPRMLSSDSMAAWSTGKATFALGLRAPHKDRLSQLSTKESDVCREAGQQPLEDAHDRKNFAF